jgi:protein subunit release factor A
MVVSALKKAGRGPDRTDRDAPGTKPDRERKPVASPQPLRIHRTDRRSLERAVVIRTYRSSRPGGQRRDKTETGVRLTHRPSGVTVTASERRSQSQNREIAFERLKARLVALNRRPKPRRPTRPPRAAEERRRAGKIRHSRKKQLRRTPADDGGA